MQTQTDGIRAAFPCVCIYLLCCLGLFGSVKRSSAGERVHVRFSKQGVARLDWGKNKLAGNKVFAVQRVVLQEWTENGEGPWGYRFTEPSLKEPEVRVDANQGRITHRYPWGRVSLTFVPQQDKLVLLVNIENSGEKTIADFELRLLDLSFKKRQGHLKRGAVQMSLDRPRPYKLNLAQGKMFVTYESTDSPVQFGFTGRHGEEGKNHSLKVLGGVPALLENEPVVPILGRPQIKPGESKQLKFVLRFAPSNTPDNIVLRPFYKKYLQAQKPKLDWSDRRPIGKLSIPSSPRYVTTKNPRGWFKSPAMDIHTKKGKKKFRSKLLDLADNAIQRMKSGNAQGVVVTNIAGGHIYPEVPYGAPRHLKDIAPEMDRLADQFFKKFSDAGLRVGVTIRPSAVFYSKRRQRWSQKAGHFMPEHETFGEDLRGDKPSGYPNECIYPVAERMSKKIQYAKERWGCSIFYIPDNGIWLKPGPDREVEWKYFDGQVLQKLQKWHPNVLLIPHHTKRILRSARSRNVIRQIGKKDRYLVYRQSLRGTAERRLAGLATPSWVIANAFRYTQTHWHNFQNKVFYGRRHVLNQAYWANAAPFVDLDLKRRIREYVLTLEQHMEYSREEANKMAEAEIPFEKTPDRVREWRPQGFSIIDTEGARTDIRRTEIVKTASWGDVLMWPATEPPAKIKALYEPAKNKMSRTLAAARQLELLEKDSHGALRPVSEVWGLGQAIDPQRLLANRNNSVPDGLRMKVAYGPGKKHALLMVAWQGRNGETIHLKPDLGELELEGSAVSVWPLTTGAKMYTKKGIKVLPDPVAGLTVMLLRGENKSPGTTKPNVLLGASFDDSPDADVGGGIPGSRKSQNVQFAAGKDGKALRLGNATQVQYGVVPNWFNGSLEFDLKALKMGKDRLPIIRLKHYVDLKLALENQHGRMSLSVEARENTLKKDKTKTRRRSVSLGRGTGTWYHITITWELGQYSIYVNGDRRQSITVPAGIATRDGTGYKPGVVVGHHQTTDTRALLDSLLIYDRYLTEETIQQRRTSQGVTPATPKPKKQMSAWLWGKFPKKVIAGVNARDVKGWGNVKKFKVELFKVLRAERRTVARATFGSFGGVAVGKLKYDPDEGVDLESLAEHAEPDIGESEDNSEVDSLTDDVMKDLGNEMKFTLEITPVTEKGKMPSRSVTVTTRDNKVTQNRW